jgi:hypothetical protein
MHLDPPFAYTPVERLDILIGGSMSSKSVAIAAVSIFLATPLTGHAVTLQVNCGQPTSKFPTINSALKALSGLVGSLTPNTINVTGACVENLSIDSLFNRLDINAADGQTSISDGSNGAAAVVSVYNSHMVVISGLTINGSGPAGKDAVTVNQSNVWLNGDTIQNATNGVSAYGNSQVDMAGGVIQNNVTGLAVFGRAYAFLSFEGGVTIQNNNQGVFLQAGALVNASAAVIRNNKSNGVFMLINSTFQCGSCSITGNGANGVAAFEGSSAMFTAFTGPYTVSDNGSSGVYLSELTSANLYPGGTVTGNAGGTDVNCGPQFATARGATKNISGGKTNCVEPQP